MSLQAVLASLLLAYSSMSFAKPMYVLVSPDSNHWKIEATGHEALSAEVEDIMMKQPEPKTRGSLGYAVKRADYPPFLKNVQSLPVLTIQGIKKMTLENSAYADLGCSNSTFFAPLKESRNKAAGEFAIGLLGGNFPARAFLKPAQVSTGKDHKPLAEQIWLGILGKVKPSAKTLLASLKAEQLRFVPIKMGSAHWIVWLEESVKSKGPTKAATSVAYSGLFDGNGEIVHELVDLNESTMSATGWRPKMIADLNGDGIEEILGEPHYYEGASMVIMELKDGIFTKTVLTSNGC